MEDESGVAAALADLAPRRSSLLAEVLEGLRAQQKSIPCKLLYDKRGSELFERICETDEYYITRTELAIMESHAAEMTELLGPGCMLIEYGSGSGQKIRMLLDRLVDPAAYVPIDISKSALEQLVDDLARLYPSLSVLPVCADYTGPHEIPEPPQTPARRVVYFPGSTIGNFTPEAARGFLEQVADTCGDGGGLLIGVDLHKEAQVLERAYDDAEGVTRDFELNVLKRLNREFGADFELDGFAYESLYNLEEQRVEMYLTSERRQQVSLDSETIPLEAGERILIEFSYKYTRERFAELAEDAGFSVERIWTDPREWFSVQYLVP